MADMEAKIEATMLQPNVVRRSRSDPAVNLVYALCPETSVGGKWLCVVVKYGDDDAFVITAYLTNQPKAGEDLWLTK